MQKGIKLLVIILCVFGLIQTASGSTITNGSFEENPGTTGYIIFDQSAIPGWQTTASDTQIEIWRSGFQGVSAYDGDYFAELNANEVSTLYQDVSGIASGTSIGYEFAHRGRSGIDKMQLTITDMGADNVIGGENDFIFYSEFFSDGNNKWGFYDSTGVSIISRGNSIRFAFESVDAAGGSKSIGNFLDAVEFGIGVAGTPNPTPEPATMLLLGIGLLGLAGISRKKK